MLHHKDSLYLITLCLVFCSCLQTGFAQDGEGTYEGIVYSYFTSEVWDFDAAQVHCQGYTSNTGGLAELTSDGIKTFVNDLITGNHKMWIGSQKISGTFTWIHSLTDTHDLSVIGAGNGKDCVYYRNSGQWKADRCTSTHGAICSRPGTIGATSGSTSSAQPTTVSITSMGSTSIPSQTNFPSSLQYLTTTGTTSVQTTALSTTTYVVSPSTYLTTLSTTSVQTTAESTTTVPTISSPMYEPQSTIPSQTTTVSTAVQTTTVSTTTLPTTPDLTYKTGSTTLSETKVSSLPETTPQQTTDTSSSEASNNFNTESGKSKLLKFLLDHRRFVVARKERAANYFSTTVPQFSGPPLQATTQTTQNVPVRSTHERVRRKKRDDSDDDCEDSTEQNDENPTPPLPCTSIFDSIRNMEISSPTSNSPMTSLAATVHATTTELDSTITESNASTPCPEGCENPQVPTHSTSDPQSNLSPGSTVTTPGVTEPPAVAGNVSQVVDLTLNTSYFSSPDFVTGLEKWLAANDEIPDDLNEVKRLEYAKDFFDVCNNVFEVDLLALGETDAASIFADSCSHLAQDLTSDLEIGESVNISTSNVDMYASVQQGRNFTGFKQVIEDDVDNANNKESEPVQVVIIPHDIGGDLHLTEEDTIALSVVVYKRGHFIVDHKNKTIDTSHRPAGSVVSITVAVNDNVTSVPVVFQLENDVSHLLRDEISQYESGNASCVFWDSTGEGEGEWNDYGCEVLNATSEFTLCACNHTTHFGVLLQVLEVKIPPEHEFALTLITYIGAGISIACLLITLLILNMLTSLTSDRVKIHKNLVTALIVAQGIFLCTSVAGRNKISCKVITLCLHYFYLSVFCWSLLEGINLYVQIVQVFSTGKTMKYIHYLLLGWGVPIPIVAISAGIRWELYGAEKQCWLTTDEGLIWAFVGPVIFVITINLIILCMVVRVIVKSASAHKKDNYDHVKAGVKGALLLVPILGLGWVFGFLSLGRATLVFTYLFVITVALQGVLIFLLYCAFNAEVRAALNRKDEKRKLRRGDGLSSVPMPSSVNSSQSNTTSTTFATKLIDRIKRRRSSTAAQKNSPVDTINLVDRSESAHSTRDITLHTRPNGSIDSGYSQNLVNTPACLPSDSMASIRTEALPSEEFIPPNTPTYEK